MWWHNVNKVNINKFVEMRFVGGIWHIRSRLWHRQMMMVRGCPSPWPVLCVCFFCFVFVFPYFITSHHLMCQRFGHRKNTVARSVGPIFMCFDINSAPFTNIFFLFHFDSRPSQSILFLFFARRLAQSNNFAFYELNWQLVVAVLCILCQTVSTPFPFYLIFWLGRSSLNGIADDFIFFEFRLLEATYVKFLFGVSTPCTVHNPPVVIQCD